MPCPAALSPQKKPHSEQPRFCFFRRGAARGTVEESLFLCLAGNGARRCYAFFVGVRPTPNPELLFYDGHCALCHGAVKFVLKHDRSENAFQFAPLQGSTFQSRITPEQRASLPDSIVVLTNENALLVRSDAFLHILRRLGGGWRFWAGLLRVIPRPLRDLGYNFIARIRYRVFGTRDDLCPVIPPELRTRFDP